MVDCSLSCAVSCSSENSLASKTDIVSEWRESGRCSTWGPRRLTTPQNFFAARRTAGALYTTSAHGITLNAASQLMTTFFPPLHVQVMTSDARMNFLPRLRFKAISRSSFYPSKSLRQHVRLFKGCHLNPRQVIFSYNSSAGIGKECSGSALPMRPGIACFFLSVSFPPLPAILESTSGLLRQSDDRSFYQLFQYQRFGCRVCFF